MTRTEDEGVFDQTTGKWMMRVAADPQAGQYVFDRELGYTFADADEGHARRFVGDPPEPLSAEEIADLRRSATSNREREAPGAWSDVLRLLDEVERSRALLKRIEWNGSGMPAGGDPDYDTEAACPECETMRITDNGLHRPGCELAALLGGGQ